MYIRAGTAIRDGVAAVASPRGVVVLLAFVALRTLNALTRRPQGPDSPDSLAAAVRPDVVTGVYEQVAAAGGSIAAAGIGAVVGLALFIAGCGVSVLAVRWFATADSEHSASGPDRDVGRATVVLAVAMVVAGICILVGLLLVVPGVIALVLVLVVQQSVTLTDRGPIDALRHSSRVVRADIFGVVTLFVAFSLVGIPLSAAQFAAVVFLPPPVNYFLSTVLGQAGTVGAIAAITSAYQQIRRAQAASEAA